MDNTANKGDDVLATPEEAFQAIDRVSEEQGGAWTPPEGCENALGRTMFDMPTSKDGTVTVLLPHKNIEALPAQALVRIESQGDGRTYIGAVAEGPFAEPDGLRADATPMVVSTVQGGLLIPRYHGRAQIEILRRVARRGRHRAAPSPAQTQQPGFRAGCRSD